LTADTQRGENGQARSRPRHQRHEMRLPRRYMASGDPGTLGDGWRWSRPLPTTGFVGAAETARQPSFLL